MQERSNNCDSHCAASCTYVRVQVRLEVITSKVVTVLVVTVLVVEAGTRITGISVVF